MYNYDRSIVAADFGPRTLNYRTRLEGLNATFTGEVGEKALEYINTLHGRLRSREPFSGIQGFISWDFGSPKELGDNEWGIRVWQKDISSYPGDLDPNIYISLTFRENGSVTAVAEAGGNLLVSKTVSASTATSGYLASLVGESWEKALTGAVDYGD